MAQRVVGELLEERHRPRNALERLIKRASLRESWTEQLRAVLPSSIAPHCRVADIRGGRLTIQVSDSSWATRLRFALPEVEKALQSLQDFVGVTEIRIRVRP